MSADPLIQPSPDPPTGFTAHASGLVVPDAVARLRDTFMADEAKLLRRGTKLLEAHHVRMIAKCVKPKCSDPALAWVEVDGEKVLRCGCTDRYFR